MNFVQITLSNRPTINDVLKILQSTAILISTNPRIEADWKSFHSLIKVPAEFKVDGRTQCSRDVFYEITQVSLKAKSGQMVTGGTKLHVQKDTNLCAYFATMSALRHQLKKIIGSQKSGEDNSTYDDMILSYEIYDENLFNYKNEAESAGGILEPENLPELLFKENLNRKDRDKRFERELAVMIGCVCPRALSAKFKI